MSARKKITLLNAGISSNVRNNQFILAYICGNRKNSKKKKYKKQNKIFNMNETAK